MARNSNPRAASRPSAARTPDGFMRDRRHNSAFDIHDFRVASLASSAITQATTSSPGDRSSGAKFSTSRYRSWPTLTWSRLLSKRIGMCSGTFASSEQLIERLADVDRERDELGAPSASPAAFGAVLADRVGGRVVPVIEHEYAGDAPEL